MPVGGWIAIAILVVVAVALGLWYVSTRNSFVRLKNNAEEAFSTMDVYMKKRYDLIPNIVNTVKGYCKHEKETLEGVVNARSLATSATTPEEKMKAEGELSGALGRLLAITEAYPDLKANNNFMDLQDQLKTIETEIANSRKYYNACVKEYNIKLQVFPSSIIANSMRLEKMRLFEITNEAERKNVKVEF